MQAVLQMQFFDAKGLAGVLCFMWHLRLRPKLPSPSINLYGNFQKVNPCRTRVWENLSKSTLSNPNSTVYQLRTSHKFAAIHSPQSSHNITQHLRESHNLCHNLSQHPKTTLKQHAKSYNTSQHRKTTSTAPHNILQHHKNPLTTTHNS